MMAKDIEYFIIEAKDKIRQSITFLDFEDIIREAKIETLLALEVSVHADDVHSTGCDFNTLVDEYIDSQTDKIDTLAAQMLRDYQEDCKAEAAEAIHLSKNGP